MTTINTQLKRVSNLIGTGDLTDWEENFISDLMAKTRQGDNTSALSEKQIEVLERIHGKHFAG